MLIPACAVAAVVIAGIMLTRLPGPAGRTAGADTETALAEGGALTYRDDSAGTTLVWLSYPADNDVAPDDEAGTLN